MAYIAFTLRYPVNWFIAYLDLGAHYQRFRVYRKLHESTQGMIPVILFTERLDSYLIFITCVICLYYYLKRFKCIFLLELRKFS